MASKESREKRIARLEREISRLRISPSLRLGSHITDAMRRPWRAPFLPLTLPWKMLMIGLEMLGRRPTKSTDSHNEGVGYQSNNTVVVFPTNGVGFGHFTRMLAIAKRMKKQDSTLEVVFFTTMPTLHLLKPYGMAAHHISGPDYFVNLDTDGWNALLEEELNLCIETHRPKMFIFDGAFPYRGMLRSISNHKKLQKVWLRRGTFRKGTSIPVDSIDHFDIIVHPEDSVALQDSEINHGVEVLTCPPIVLLDSDEMLSREIARTRLLLPMDARAVYVQLGAGEINDINSEIRITVEALTNYEDVHVVIGESMIGNRLDISLERVHIIRDYPNSIYFNAFDAAVQAGGYNSFHEVRNFGISTLFYPNMETGMDDQHARCQIAEKEGWGIVLESRTEASIHDACSKLLSLEPPALETRTVNGANELSLNLFNIFMED